MARAARANGVVEARLTDGRRGGSDARARRTQVGSEVVQAFGGERPRDVVRAERRQRRVRDARDRLQVRIVARRRRLRLILFLRGRLRPARRRRRRRRPRGAPRRFRGAEPPHDDAREDAAAWRPSSSAAPLALQSVVASDDVASRHESFSETPRLTDASSWELLAQTEHQIITNPGTAEHHYGLFGGAPNSGPASSVILWQRVQDPGSDTWSMQIEQALIEVSPRTFDPKPC